MYRKSHYISSRTFPLCHPTIVRPIKLYSTLSYERFWLKSQYKILLEGIKAPEKRKLHKNFTTKATKVSTLLPYRIKMKFQMSIKTFGVNESRDTFETKRKTKQSRGTLNKLGKYAPSSSFLALKAKGKFKFHK
jgi:hypothetical protein